MPLVDIAIALLILLAAFIGYQVGLLGAVKGFISNCIGLVLAWIFSPVVAAWMQSRWGIVSYLAAMIQARLPEALETLIRTAAQTALTVSEFQDNLVGVLPSDVAPYVQKSMLSPLLAAPTPDQAIEALSLSIAQNILWALLFFLLWTSVSVLVKGFLGSIMFRGDGKTILGVFDGFLGMAALTFIVVGALIGISGFVIPLAILSNPEGAIARIYPYLMEASLVQWMQGIYHQYIA